MVPQRLMADEVLTIAEAAERLKVSTKTIERLLRSGELPAGKIGRQWRISSAILDQLVRGELQRPKPAPKPRKKSKSKRRR
jgi:excisionase family DNA binding protein